MRIIPDYLIGVITVFQEAENQSYEGKRAVAEVIQRRTRNKFMSDGTVTSTCLRKYQFSGWNTDAPNRTRSMKIDTKMPMVDETVKAWLDAERGPEELVPGCMHYYNPSIADPLWAKDAIEVAVIGDHRFVIPVGGK